MDDDMKNNDNYLGERETAQGLSDLLLKEITRLCADFRTGDPDEELDDTGAFPLRTNFTTTGLNSRIKGMLDRFPQTGFTKGIDTLAIRALPETSQALFYCFIGLFLSQPITPVDISFFESTPSSCAFKAGIDALLRNELVTAVTVNSPDDSKARKDRYILSPLACSRLFRGKEDLVSASAAIQFGTILQWKDIQEKKLVFSDDLLSNLQLISMAVSRDRFEAVQQELKQNGFRGGLAFLLSGPPGTGKTEFVRQLARVEHRHIFQVDAAKIDGSYFGEKPRNLRDLFLFSRYMSAIMQDEPVVFIDEADSLLGRRVEVSRSSDREENLSVNIILEEMNTFSGILFAATNNLVGLDPAMLRRFLLRAVFPVPDISLRAQIWQSKMPFLTKKEAMDVAGRFALSGGLIDNIASLCLLERILYGREPSYDQLIRHCVSQTSDLRATPKIGFK